MTHAATPDSTLIEVRDALGFALSDALESLSDAEVGITDDTDQGLVENLDEAQMFVQDALFEALLKFGTREGDDFVWRSDQAEVFRAPRVEVAEHNARREAATIEVGA